MTQLEEPKVKWHRTNKFLELHPEIGGRKSLINRAQELGAVWIGRGYLWPEDCLEKLSERQRQHVEATRE